MSSNSSPDLQHTASRLVHVSTPHGDSYHPQSVQFYQSGPRAVVYEDKDFDEFGDDDLDELA